MVVTIIREEKSNPCIYFKDFGQIKLANLSVERDKLHMIVTDSLYRELANKKSLDPPFKKIEMKEEHVKEIKELAGYAQKPESKIQEMQKKLRLEYSLNFA